MSVNQWREIVIWTDETLIIARRWCIDDEFYDNFAWSGSYDVVFIIETTHTFIQFSKNCLFGAMMPDMEYSLLMSSTKPPSNQLCDFDNIKCEQNKIENDEFAFRFCCWLFSFAVRHWLRHFKAAKQSWERVACWNVSCLCWLAAEFNKKRSNAWIGHEKQYFAVRTSPPMSLRLLLMLSWAHHYRFSWEFLREIFIDSMWILPTELNENNFIANDRWSWSCIV